MTVPHRPDLEALREELIAAALPLDRFIASDGYPGMRVRSDTEAADIVLAVLDRRRVMRALAITAEIDALDGLTPFDAGLPHEYRQGFNVLLRQLRSITGEQG